MSGLAVIVAFAASWLVLAYLLRSRKFLPMDRPNARSLHVTPTPCIGGIGILTGVLAASVWYAGAEFLPVVLIAFLLAALSLLDDVRGLPVALRFSAHFAAALAGLFMISLSGWPWLLGTLVVVWMTNLYNFMDGADGLAGGMATVGFGALGIGAWQGGAQDLAVLCASISAASLAFLRFNFPPARIFMGDAGSIPLGFLAAILGIYGIQRGIWHWLFPLLVFAPFVVDASVTLIRRLLRGEKIWRAHRTHYYQRVVLMGASHRQLAWAAYALMLAGAGTALLLLPALEHAAILGAAWAVSYTMIFLMIDWRWHSRRNEH